MAVELMGIDIAKIGYLNYCAQAGLGEGDLRKIEIVGEPLARHIKNYKLAPNIVQPVVTKVGGISEERRIAWMAQEHGIRFIPHGWNTAVGVAADLQLASAFPETDLVDYLTGPPYVDEIAARPWQLDVDGWLQIPDQPGLGLELDRDALARYTRGAILLP